MRSLAVHQVIVAFSAAWTPTQQEDPPISKIQSMQLPQGVKLERSATTITATALLSPPATNEDNALTSACTSCERKRCSTLQPTHTLSLSDKTAQPTRVGPMTRAASRTRHACGVRRRA